MYTLIEHKKLDAAAASITFSNIPQTYTDLYLLVSARSDGTGNNYTGLGINGVNTNQTSRFLYGTGSGTGSVSLTGASDYNAIAYMPISTTTSNTFSSASFYIPNYTSNVAKSISIDAVAENNATAGQQEIMAALWNSTAAITSLTVASVAGSSLQASGNMVSGSSATLYGINRKTAIGKPKAIGGNITYANGYWVHTFTGSGTFYPTQPLTVDALIAAGGGGGGDVGGGGGAGGVQYHNGLAVSSAFAVTIGAGGSASNNGANGTPSSMLGLSTVGGGGGGGYQASGASGGSGGGGGSFNGAAGGAGTSGQGNNGGAGSVNGTSAARGAGGGGGAGATGSAGIYGGTGGAGGSGVPWNGTFYAGGGGGEGYYTGGTGGRGGGGNGGTNASPATAGAIGTGSGGGGSQSFTGHGGSGVVVIRYRAD